MAYSSEILAFERQIDGIRDRIAERSRRGVDERYYIEARLQTRGYNTKCMACNIRQQEIELFRDVGAKL